MTLETPQSRQLKAHECATQLESYYRTVWRFILIRASTAQSEIITLDGSVLTETHRSQAFSLAAKRWQPDKIVNLVSVWVTVFLMCHLAVDICIFRILAWCLEHTKLSDDVLEHLHTWGVYILAAVMALHAIYESIKHLFPAHHNGE